MSKDPAFLFYPGDWLGGTLGMTFEEKGAYMELLMLQFNRGHMTSHMVGQVVGQLWLKLLDKFIQDENGLWYNNRLEIEINKRKLFVSSRNNNLEGKNQYSKKDGHINGHMTSHMENENENIIVNKEKEKTSSKSIKFKPPEINQVIKYFAENGYSEDAGKRAFNFYDVANWVDSKGLKVRNWKQKMQGVWFKDENKAVKKPYNGVLA